jgi:hypothetical protein
MMTNTHLTRIYLTIAMVFLPLRVQAAEINGVKFNQTYQDRMVTMTLKGTGLKTMLFFKAFVAGFYTNANDCAYDVADVSKRIEVEYFVSIPSKKLNDYTIERMKDNITSEEFRRISQQVKLMEHYFVDLKSGDRFSLTYIPGEGTQFAHNGKITGTIEGNEFARALFSVWVGEKPFDRQLKAQICGIKNV